MNAIYLICEREFIKSGESVFKIGRSAQEGLKRFKSYPKGSQLLLQVSCLDCKKSEKSLIAKFKQTYKPRPDIGAEYFEGCKYRMMDDIYDYVKRTR